MLIAELRGSIVTIRAEKLSVSYLDQIQESKKETNKTISDVLLNGDIGLTHKDFNDHYNQRALQLNGRGELIVTGLDKDSYYEEGYSFFRSKLHRLRRYSHSYIDFGWPGDYFILTVEFEIGLFKQLKIPIEMEQFSPKKLQAISSTLLSTPTYKTISNLSYDGVDIEEGNSFGYEKKGLFVGIVEPQKSLFFNKILYRHFIDKSYSVIQDSE